MFGSPPVIIVIIIVSLPRWMQFTPVIIVLLNHHHPVIAQINTIPICYHSNHHHPVIAKRNTAFTELLLQLPFEINLRRGERWPLELLLCGCSLECCPADLHSGALKSESEKGEKVKWKNMTLKVKKESKWKWLFIGVLPSVPFKSKSEKGKTVR